MLMKVCQENEKSERMETEYGDEAQTQIKTQRERDKESENLAV